MISSLTIRIVGVLLVGSVCLVGMSTAWAVSLEFAPVTQTVELSDPVMVDVVISGLTAGGDPSVGSFDLDVTYDPGVLTATGVTFGPHLGDGLDSLQAVVLAPGVVDFSELSFLFDLSAQPASFTLATVSFATAGVGVSALTFSQSLIGDALGFDLLLTLGAGSVTVEAIPEPSTLLLLGTGLAGLVAWRVRKQYIP